MSKIQAAEPPEYDLLWSASDVIGRDGSKFRACGQATTQAVRFTT